MGSEKQFPIQRSYSKSVTAYRLLIPWSVAELAYSVYASRYGNGQTLERLAERGGFGPEEMDDLLPGWRERCDELASLRAQLADRDKAIAVLAKENRILTLSFQLEEDLANRIDEACKYIAMGQGYTPDGLARLLVDCQKRMAADWIEIGRLRRENNLIASAAIAGKDGGG